jgi:hypothetical protein
MIFFCGSVYFGQKVQKTMWDFKFSRRRVWCSELSSGMIRDGGGSTHLWNVGRQSFYTAVHLRRQFWTSKNDVYFFQSRSLAEPRLRNPALIQCLYRVSLIRINLTREISLMFGFWRYATFSNNAQNTCVLVLALNVVGKSVQRNCSHPLFPTTIRFAIADQILHQLVQRLNRLAGGWSSCQAFGRLHSAPSRDQITVVGWRIETSCVWVEGVWVWGQGFNMCVTSHCATG